jgi:hypothetical protein
MSSDYESLKKSILADGVIDADEVKKLREKLYADGVIDREEADFLFELNDATSGTKNDSNWQTLFVDAISSYLLDDKTSPAEIDDAEADWLIAHVEKDVTYDDNEKSLLNNLKAKAKKVSAKLQGKF